ncbi:M14 metallopeptidase family protein [Ignavibacteria bacterium 4148-Me]|uniref:M14 family metallopeptidase n=1 Tax=Rosettibacter primus TaxID=3111523 RepID=UPI00336C1627
MITRIILLIFSFITILYSQQIKSPEEFLGFKVGTDYKIANYETIHSYFKHLAQFSNKIIYKEIGKTSLGRDMFMAVISSEENIKNVDRFREIIKKLSDPRKISDDEAKLLAKEGKIIVLVTCNIHSTEIASSQMSMELAYNLLTNKSSQEIIDALNNVIFILMPSINPDGTSMVVDWYYKNLNTEFDGAPMPWLYHVYAGHDNNRDWFMFNLSETRNVIKVAYHEWIPQIWLDEHQMGSNGARLFLVPYKDPINPNVNPLIWRWQGVIGSLTALHLDKLGYNGIINQALFEAWWEGPASDCGLWHNQIALLSEMASCNIASPIYIDPSEIKATNEITTYDIRTNYPNPWRGGWWRLHDIVNYELALTEALLKISSDYKEELLLNFYNMAKEAIQKGKTEKPFAYIIPRQQNDPVTTSKMIEILQLGGVEVNFIDKEFQIDNVIYPANSYIIYLAQPNGRYVKDLFEEQNYPDLRKSKNEPPLTPYDVAGWTLPYLMGVKFYQIDKPFEINSVKINEPLYQNGFVSEDNGKYFIAPSGLNVNSALINRLQKNGIPVYWNTEKLVNNGKTYNQGSVVIEVNSKSKQIIKKAASELHLQIDVVDDIHKEKLKEIRKITVGLYQPWTANMDEGWTRLLLENYEFNFITLHNKDFKDKKLKQKCDVIIIPDMSADIIKNGKPSGDAARFYRPKPAEYDSGIGKVGLENLKNFIEKDGGYLITLGEACNFAIEDLGLRVTNVLKNLKSNEFFCPGSLLRIKVDNTNPIGYGMEQESIAYVSDNIAFATTIPFGKYDRSIVVRFPDKNLLKSGFLIGEDYLFNKAAIVDVKQKNGHVILMGFKVQNRHWTFGTFKLLFNAIHYAGMI